MGEWGWGSLHLSWPSLVIFWVHVAPKDGAQVSRVQLELLELKYGTQNFDTIPMTFPASKMVPKMPCWGPFGDLF